MLLNGRKERHSKIFCAKRGERVDVIVVVVVKYSQPWNNNRDGCAAMLKHLGISHINVNISTAAETASGLGAGLADNSSKVVLLAQEIPSGKCIVR